MYPQYLTLSIGTIDWTSARLVGVVLLIRTLVYGVRPEFGRLLWMDVLVLAEYLGDASAHLITGPISKAVVREGGEFFDIVIPYLLVRLSLRDREDVFLLFRSIVMVALPLAAVGIYQSVTGTNPYGFLRAFSPWEIGEQNIDNRLGLFRADGPFGNKIAFGLFFSMAIMLHAISLASRKGIRPHVWLAKAGGVVIGLVSAMSSAPVFAFVVSIGWLGTYPLRRYLPYFFAGFLAFLLFIELYSNRHFYHVLTRFALDGSTAYYRIELMEEALGGGMDGHWVAGYGYVGVGPGTDNTNFHWRHTDLVNIYIARLATGGLLSLLPFMVLNTYYYWCLYRIWGTARTLQARWSIWCLSAGMIGWNVAMMTVAPLAQIGTLFAMMIGVIAVWRVASAHEAHLVEEEQRVLSEVRA